MIETVNIILFSICIILIFMYILKRVNSYNSIEFYTVKDYPEMKIIEDNWEVILSEIPKFDISIDYPMRDNSWFNLQNPEDIKDYISKFKSNWYQGWQGENIWYNYPLFFNNNVIDSAETTCPKTVEILKKVKCKQIVGYSILLPGGALKKHRDPTGKKFQSMAANLLLTNSNNSNCIILDDYGNEKKYLHKQGKMVIFDATNLHYANNNDDKNRTILYIDFSTK